MSKNTAILPTTLPHARTRDRIHLEGISFDGRHGWFAAERERDRTFRVDLTVALSLSEAGNSDWLDDTLDYNRLADIVVAVGTGTQFKLVERLAAAIAEAILEGCPVEAVEVTVHKPAPAIAGNPTAAAVTIYRAGE